MGEDAYVMHKLDYECVMLTFKAALSARPWAAEDYQPTEDEVRVMFLYALGLEGSGAPGYYVFSPATRNRAAMRAAAGFVAAIGPE